MSNTFRDYDQIKQLPDPISLSDIETAEAVLRYCADAQYMTFNVTHLSEVLASTTNVLRWNRGFQILDLELRDKNTNSLILETRIDKP